MRGPAAQPGHAGLAGVSAPPRPCAPPPRQQNRLARDPTRRHTARPARVRASRPAASGHGASRGRGIAERGC